MRGMWKVTFINTLHLLLWHTSWSLWMAGDVITDITNNMTHIHLSWSLGEVTSQVFYMTNSVLSRRGGGDIYPVYTEQNSLKRDLNHYLDHYLDPDPEDGPVYTGQSMLNVTKSLFDGPEIAIHPISGLNRDPDRVFTQDKISQSRSSRCRSGSW